MVEGNDFPDFIHHTSGVWEVEKFDSQGHSAWMRANWHYSVVACSVYLILVFLGQNWMHKRQRYTLKTPLVLWNVGLALFSIFGFWRSFGDLWHEWIIKSEEYGESNISKAVVRSICSWEYRSVTTLFWGFLFTASKILEFGDTAFIVLRKQKLILLHWYHHVTVCLYTWICYPTYDPATRWFCVMNFFVHSVMYSYYGLRALGVKIPSGFAMSITTLQILQMVIGLFLNLYSLYIIKSGVHCERPMANVYAGFAMYASYFVLFLNFFVKSYRRKDVRPLKGKKA